MKSSITVSEDVVVKLDISNLVCRLNVKNTVITHVKVLQYGGAFRFT